MPKPRKTRPFDPTHGWLGYGFAVLRMQQSAAQVIAHRSVLMTSGKMGLTEASTMITEKYIALASGTMQAGLAAARGADPAQIANAALQPVRAKAQSNANRLRR